MSENQSPQKNDDEIDLGSLFKYFESLIIGFFRFLGDLAKRVLNFIIAVLLFLRRRIVILVIGTVVGILWTFINIYRSSGSTVTYENSMIVAPYSGANAYVISSVKYLNNLVETNKVNELAEELEIKPNQALSILKFEILPNKSETTLMTLYNGFLKKSDSSLIRQVNFEQFKNSIDEADYSEYVIRMVTSDNTLFGKVNKGLNKILNENQALLEYQKEELQKLEDSKTDLQGLLGSIDTINNSVSKSLRNNGGGNNSVLVTGTGSSINPDALIKTYQSTVEKISELQEEINGMKNLVKVISPFSSNGERIGVFNKDNQFTRNAVFFTLLALVGSLLYDLNKYLAMLDRQGKFRMFPNSDELEDDNFE